MNDKEINVLADAIDRYLDRQDRIFKLREDARKNGFRIVYKRRLQHSKGFDPVTGFNERPRPVFERKQGVLWMTLRGKNNGIHHD